MLQGYGCPKCSNKIPYTNETFKFKIFHLVGNEYTLLSKFTSTKTKIKVRHNVCGREYWVMPNSFLNGTRCKECDKRFKNTEQLKKEIYNLVQNEYELLSEYANSKMKVLIKHKVCDHQWWVLPGNFLNKNSRCPKCFGNYHYTTNEFKQKIFELVGVEYHVLGEYINAITPTLFRHNICGCKFMIRPSSFISNGIRCPQCNESKGEVKIRKWLTFNNLVFNSQYTFNDLIGLGGGLLKFDFVVFDNNKIISIVEYDGEQHFRYINGMMKIEDYYKSQQHDILKNLYCAKNNIPLIRIPYWEFDNVEKYLEEYLIIN